MILYMFHIAIIVYEKHKVQSLDLHSVTSIPAASSLLTVTARFMSVATDCTYGSWSQVQVTKNHVGRVDGWMNLMTCLASHYTLQAICGMQ